MAAPTAKSPSPAAKAAPHRWHFYRAGGVDQARIDSGADILHLDELDQKLWVALSCPVKGLEFDTRTLELLDSDHDSHVRPPEILATVRWLREVLKSADDLAKGVDGVALANLRQDTPEGKAIAASVQHMLKALGKEKATVITVADTMATAEIMKQAKLNGDGIVAVDAIEDPKAKAVAADIVACLGATTDRSGQPGFDQQKLDAFYAECAAYAAWHQQAQQDPKNVLPFGDNTAACCAALDAVRTKIDDYFARCRLAAFDPRALAVLNREEKAYLEVTAKDLSITAQEVAHFPLAMVEANKPLPLSQGVNPAWAAPLAAFQAACAKGKTTLTEAEWTALCAKFDGYRAWLAGKKGALVEPLGIARIQAILAGGEKAVLQQAIAEDLSVADQVAAMTKVEKLARLHRDFQLLLNNYVSFRDFYSRRGAIFQAGTLFFDGRSLDMCFHVNDVGKHAAMAAMAKTYLAYVECTRPGCPKMTVACAFTAGDSDNLFVGRNGLFYDRKGQDWDATITKIIDNPISIGQAFWSPYKKVMRWIEESVAKRAAAADEASTAKLQTAAETTGDAAKTGEVKAKPKFDVGVVAALGVAVGGITAALTGLLDAFFGLGIWMPVGIVGLLLAISGPSMLIAWLKLRQRNLGPILDANGWAVNTLTKVNLPLGRALTDLPHLPSGSSRSLVDPYAPKKSKWPRVLLVLLLLAGVGYALYRTNLLHKWLPDYVPAHHTELDLGADKSSAAPGEVVTLTVRSSASELVVTDDTDTNNPRQLAKLPVDASKKVVFTVPAEQKPGMLRITDTTSATEVKIRVTEAPK